VVDLKPRQAFVLGHTTVLAAIPGQFTNGLTLFSRDTH
jgi:hypothetical protein